MVTSLSCGVRFMFAPCHLSVSCGACQPLVRLQSCRCTLTVLRWRGEKTKGQTRMVKLARLRYWREHAPMTQDELAIKAGVRRQTIIAIEAGKEPRPETTRR